MHGDDVASAGVEVTTKVVSQTTEIIMDILKLAIEREREQARLKKSDKQQVLYGGEVTYRKLQEGGEVTSTSPFDKNDYGELVKRAKKMNIPVAAIQENGKENTLTVFFNVKDKEALNAIVQDIHNEKLKEPGQAERMVTIEKEQVEGFQMYCSEHDIPVCFMESKDGIKCIYGSEYEKQINAAMEKYNGMSAELNNTDISLFKDEKGKLKIKIDDGNEQKQLTMNFSTKARLERVLKERLGYSEFKAVEAANRLASTMTDEQLGYYLSGSRQMEQMVRYEKDIRYDDDNVLLDKLSFAKMQFQENDPMRLTVTDERGHFIVISEKNKNRAAIEQEIKQHLKVTDTETITAIMDKAERMGFVEVPKQVLFKEYQIERDTQSSFTVRGGSTIVRLDLGDRDAARKRLRDTFGMSEAKADRIIGKAQKQSVANNLLTRARARVQETADTLKRKKRERGSRK